MSAVFGEMWLGDPSESRERFSAWTPNGGDWGDAPGEANSHVQRESHDPAEGPQGETAFATVTSRRGKGPAAIAVAAIAFLSAAVLIKQLAPVSPSPGSNAKPPPASAAAAVATTGPTVEPTPSATADPPSLDPTVTPHPTFPAIPAAPGINEVSWSRPPTASVVISLPAGWKQADAGLFVKSDPAGPVGLSIGVYQIEHINLFPCRWASHQYTDTYPWTAAGQAQALSAFWGQDPNQTPFFSNSPIAPIATKPAPSTLGGYPAWRLQILIPSTFDFSVCDGSQLILWETPYETVRAGLGAGEIDKIWVVDVHGALVVVDAALPLLASKAQETELQAVIDSVAFPR